jgi:hypothetical protein
MPPAEGQPGPVTGWWRAWCSRLPCPAYRRLPLALGLNPGAGSLTRLARIQPGRPGVQADPAGRAAGRSGPCQRQGPEPSAAGRDLLVQADAQATIVASVQGLAVTKSDQLAGQSNRDLFVLPAIPEVIPAGLTQRGFWRASSGARRLRIRPPRPSFLQLSWAGLLGATSSCCGSGSGNSVSWCGSGSGSSVASWLGGSHRVSVSDPIPRVNR